MKNFLFAMLCIGFMSCQQQNKKIDKTDILQYGKVITEDIILGKLDIKKHFKNDSIHPNIKYEIVKMQRFFKDREFQIIHSDTVESENGNGIIWTTNNCFIESENNYFDHAFLYQRNVNNHVVIPGAMKFVPLKKCDELYAPEEFKILASDWIDLKNNYITSFRIRVQNTTEYNVDYVKLRLSLSRKDSNVEFFNKTIEINQKVNAGDMAYFEIPDLDNFFVGYKMDGNNTMMKSEVVSVKPNNSYDCRKIQELDKILGRN